MIARSQQDVINILEGHPNTKYNLSQFIFTLAEFDEKTEWLKKLERQRKGTASVISKGDNVKYASEKHASSDDCFTKEVTPKATSRSLRKRPKTLRKRKETASVIKKGKNVEHADDVEAHENEGLVDDRD